MGGPHYRPFCRRDAPYELLARAQPGVTYAVISELRRFAADGGGAEVAAAVRRAAPIATGDRRARARLGWLR